MNKNLWVVLAIVILVAAGGYYFYQNQSGYSPSTPTPTTTPQIPTSTESATTPAEQMTVTYSDSGFSPASLTVKAGDTVTFKNESLKDMRVASAPHPTHTNYPEFDAKVGSPKGEEYMFTFIKAGTWKYHNHLNPSSIGTIIVE